MVKSTTTFIWFTILLSTTTIILAEEECGSGFGNDNERELIPVTDERFYLNTANPAPCTGNITGWHLCYYGPNLIQPLTQYWATYAVYRKIGAGSDERYERVSEVYSAVRGPPFAALFGNTGLIKSGFSCNDYSVETNTSQLTIQAGDVLGACVFTPIDGEFFLRQRLDIVGQTSGESLLGMDTSACNTKFLPTSVTVNELSTYDSRRLHLYADIVPYEPPTMSEKTTDPNSSVTDQSNTEDHHGGVNSSTSIVGIVLGTLLSTVLLTIIVAVVISIIGYSKYKKTKSDDEEQDNTDDLTYNYMYQNPPKVSDLQLEHSISDARTPESREELTTGIEQKSTMSYEESEMSLFPNAAYTKKAFNKAIAATNVLYECIDKSVQTPLQINNDDEYEYV